MNKDLKNPIERDSIDIHYMKMAYLVSERSTCLRRRVGAVIVKDKQLLSSGYNGAPVGLPHCTTDSCTRMKLHIPSGEKPNLCLTGDTIIKLLDGTYKTIKELADKGEDFWVYSIDNVGKIVPGLATNPHLTGYRDDIIEITFNNSKTLKCTSNHKILLKNNKYKETKDLKSGDKCMPIYYSKNTFESVSTDLKNINYTHELVYKYINPVSLYKNISHKDGNKYNNTPSNLTTKDENLNNDLSQNVPEGVESDYLEVISIKQLDSKHVPVYDISVLEHENFAVDLGNNTCVVVSNCRSVHAEMNAICQAAKNGVNINGGTIYCTTFPCIYCAKSLVNAGIKRLVYCEGYGVGEDPLTLEMLQNIQVDRINKDLITK